MRAFPGLGYLDLRDIKITLFILLEQMKVHDRVEDALIVFLIEVLDAFVILALGTLMSCLGVKFFLGLVI